MRGLPASGKTTYAKFIATQIQAVRISRDDIRTTLFGEEYHEGSPKPECEDIVTSQQKAMITDAIKRGIDVIVDDTNLGKGVPQRFRDMARNLGARFVIVNVGTVATECQRRNLERRDGGGRFVPSDVIERMDKRLPRNKWPDVKERKPLTVEKYVRPKGKRRAFIFDIDGTLANHEGVRSPYDYTNVFEDAPHEDVIEMVRELAMYDIIVMSGRDDTCREDTIRWLDAHGVPFDELHMRPTAEERGQKAPDTAVKLKLFNEHVRDNYDVAGVFDDRSSVVQLWRDLGLRCYQVAPGMF